LPMSTLSLTTYLDTELSPVVWSTVLKHIERLRKTLALSPSAYNEFKTYFSGKIGAVLGNAAIGYNQGDGDGGALVILRSKLLDWACALELPACRTHAQEIFEAWSVQPRPQIHVDVRPVIFCGAVGADVANFDTALNIYKVGVPQITSQDKGFLLNALACTDNKERIDKLLSDILVEDPEEAEIDKEDRLALFKAILTKTYQGREAAISILVTLGHGPTLIQEFKQAGILEIYTFLSGCALRPTQVTSLEAFITSYADMLVEIKEQLLARVATMKENNVWLDKNGQDLHEWFAEANTPATP